jgi:hypothetical protein
MAPLWETQSASDLGESDDVAHRKAKGRVSVDTMEQPSYGAMQTMAR